jgi:hypothetical protein|tara:strand:+ start:103 stop:336 length:234 start_codon:yes stop_codon:yes gene_type:complete
MNYYGIIINIIMDNKEEIMATQKIYVKHKDEIFEELLNTYKKCANRKVRPSISDENYGYIKALEWVLNLNETIKKES